MEKYLLIKAWGFGFWSDVGHVLTYLLLAEITHRSPIIYWGSNSFYNSSPECNAFNDFFKPVNDIMLEDIRIQSNEIWPPKWTVDNLFEPEVNKRVGPYSKIVGLHLLARHEKMIVADFHTDIKSVMSWLPMSHPANGLTVDQTMRYLANKYLEPVAEISDRVEEFYNEHLSSEKFIAVHTRGSDKAKEVDNLSDINLQYFAEIDRLLSEHKCSTIFLMTDESRILQTYKHRFGTKIVTTECARTDNDKGLLGSDKIAGKQLGLEIMLDVLLATRAQAFVGNGTSNASVFVKYLKDWGTPDAILIGDNIFHSYNSFLHSN